MNWKSLKEEWPYSNDDVWLRWTTDAVNWNEKIVHEKEIDRVACLGVAEWRELEPPEWLNEVQKVRFEEMREQGVSWQNRVSRINQEEYDAKNPL